MLRSTKTAINHLSKSFHHKTQARIVPGKRLYTMTHPRDLSATNIVHDEHNKEFFINLKDGAKEGKAYLQYSEISPDYVDLEHTVVPVEFRGHGVAKVLAQGVFDHFVDKGTMFRPTCSYLQKYYNENQLPQYKDKVKWD